MTSTDDRRLRLVQLRVEIGQIHQGVESSGLAMLSDWRLEKHMDHAVVSVVARTFEGCTLDVENLTLLEVSEASLPAGESTLTWRVPLPPARTSTSRVVERDRYGRASAIEVVDSDDETKLTHVTRDGDGQVKTLETVWL